MNRPAAHLVQSPKQWSVLIGAVRSEIAETLRLIGPCSVADIAAATARPADTLYRHLQLLQKAGFVKEAGFRKSGRHIEQLFDVTADDFVVDFKDNTGRAENRAIVRTANSFLKAMGRAVRDSAAAGVLDFQPDSRNISINYELSWLTPGQYQEVRALIRRLKQLMDEGKRHREGRLYMTLAISTPVTRRPRTNKKKTLRRSQPKAERSARGGVRRDREA